MPNIVSNTITFPNDLAYQSFIAKYGNNIDTKKDGAAFSFNWIIPEPRTKEECGEKFLISGKGNDGIKAEKDRPWYNWSFWRKSNWGTKWDAVGDDGQFFFEEQNCICFETAWDPPFPVYRRMAELGLEFEFDWDIECGMNSGTGYAKNGELVVKENEEDKAQRKALDLLAATQAKASAPGKRT